VTQCPYFRNVDESLTIFCHQVDCFKIETSRLQNIRLHSALRKLDCDAQCQRYEFTLSNCCIGRLKNAM